MDYKALRQRVRESAIVGHAYVALQRLAQRNPRGNKREVIFFPGQMYSGSAGDLRAWAVARELRTLGWRTFVVPPWLSLKARHSIIKRHPSALLFFQQSRHEFNLPALYPSHRTIFDADDADILVEPERVIECLKSSTAIIAGSHFLADAFRPYNSNVSVVWTGTYITSTTRTERPDNRPIIAWAQSEPFNYLVEAELVKNLWLSLAKAGLEFSVAVYSYDPQRVKEWLEPLEQAGIPIIIRPKMRYADFIKSLADVAIGLQPICPSHAFSQGKSFGKVLAYLAADVPVIASREVDHELFFRDGENGLLVSTESEWITACKRLLENRAEREALAKTARHDLLTRLTTRKSAEKIALILEGVLGQ